MLKLKLSLEMSLGPLQALKQELAQTVDPAVMAHWNAKISAGIVPTEILNQGEVDWAKHTEERKKLVEFETRVLAHLFLHEWKPANWEELDEAKEIHYVGVGDGEALLALAHMAAVLNYAVIAYDTSEVGVENAELALEKVYGEEGTLVFLADILSVCESKCISTKKGSKLILPRVLHVLDTQEPDWKDKLPHDGKMARTLRRIGALHFPDVLIIHPCPEDNPRAIWGDTTPHTLEEIQGYMEEGSECELEFKKLDIHSFHGHVYTAVLIRPK
jgi:hypothetical protein